MKTYDAYYKDFEKYLYSNYSSKNTINSYLIDIKKYLSYTDDNFMNMTKQDIISYLNTIGSKYSQATVLRNLASIRKFYKFLISNGILSENPADKINIKKPKHTEIHVLTTDEIDLLLSKPDNNTFKDSRNKAILHLLYATGLKVSNLINLNVEDVDLVHGVLYYKLRKESKKAFIYPSALSSLTNYIYRFRVTIADENTHALFINTRGDRLSRQGVWKIIKLYAADVGIDENAINPSVIRYSFALHLLHNNATFNDIKDLMGYNKGTYTNTVFNLLDEELRRYHKYHPKA